MTEVTVFFWAARLATCPHQLLIRIQSNEFSNFKKKNKYNNGGLTEI